jgi:hypothetical protein
MYESATPEFTACSFLRSATQPLQARTLSRTYLFTCRSPSPTLARLALLLATVTALTLLTPSVGSQAQAGVADARSGFPLNDVHL